MANNVSFTRPEMSRLLKLYYLIRDCISGEITIKDQRELYLPIPNADDVSPKNKERYKAYLLRAVFYNVTRRTLLGLIGQVFMRDPIFKIPDLLKPVEIDATGTGISLIQQSKRALSYVLAYSRCGLFVDYPYTNEETSIEEVSNGTIRPTISSYAPYEIINWRVIEDGSKELLSLVVLCEDYCHSDDGFEMKNSNQYRVLKLDKDGNYCQEIWRENIPTSYEGRKPKKGNFEIYSTVKPLDSSGKPFKEIPFIFLGSENNDVNPDDPNMYDLASINIAHYRNSADYEEACYIMGQPTIVISGLTEDWVKTVLNGAVNFGSRGGIPLPVGGAAQLLQASENTMIKEAMETKERQMVALGAKLVEQKEVQRTAFETKVEATGEGSVLATSTKNVATGIEWALKWCAKFVGQNEDSIKFELNTDFDIARMTTEERSEIIKEWQSGAITFEEMRTTLRKAGVVTENDAAAKTKIDAEKEATANMQIKVNQSSKEPPSNAA